MKAILRIIGNGVAYSWAAFCILATVFVVADVEYDLVTKVLASAVFLAAAPMPLLALRSFRRRQRRRDARAKPALRQTPKGLSATDRIAFAKLMDAYDEAAHLADVGLVPRKALTDVDERIAQLGLLLRADTRSLRLGGRLSTELRHRMRELTGQLVALVDLVVDREASAMDGPVGLREARRNNRGTCHCRRRAARPHMICVAAPGGRQATQTTTLNRRNGRHVARPRHDVPDHHRLQ